MIKLDNKNFYEFCLLLRNYIFSQSDCDSLMFYELTPERCLSEMCLTYSTVNDELPTENLSSYVEFDTLSPDNKVIHLYLNVDDIIECYIDDTDDRKKFLNYVNDMSKHSLMRECLT